MNLIGEELKPGHERFEIINPLDNNGTKVFRYSYLHPVYGMFETTEIFSERDPEFSIKMEMRKRKRFWIKQKKETE